MPELALPYSQNDDYIKYYRRTSNILTFIQQLMETEAETCIKALDCAPKVQLKSGGVRIWTRRSRPSWVHPLKQSTLANGSSTTPGRQESNKHRSKLVPLNVGDSAMAGSDWGVTGSGTRIYPYASTGFLGMYITFSSCLQVSWLTISLR